MGYLCRQTHLFSHLQLDEFILTSTSRDGLDESSINVAPEPLLPNYGLGGIRPYDMDIVSLAVANSCERTAAQFIQLGQQADLTYVKAWDLGETGLMEFAKD